MRRESLGRLLTLTAEGALLFLLGAGGGDVEGDCYNEKAHIHRTILAYLSVHYSDTTKQHHCRFRFICCFTSCSTARVILQRVVHRWRKPVQYVHHRASASNYQLSNMKHLARDSNRRPQRLGARTLTASPPSPPQQHCKISNEIHNTMGLFYDFYE